MTSATDSAAAFHGIAEAAVILLKARMAYVWVDEGGEALRDGGSSAAGRSMARREGAGRLHPIRCAQGRGLSSIMWPSGSRR
jgi:hypothetical protein